MMRMALQTSEVSAVLVSGRQARAMRDGLGRCGTISFARNAFESTTERSPACPLFDALRLSGLDDEQPWTEQLVIARPDFLCRSVRATARLVGPAIVASSMHELVALCM